MTELRLLENAQVRYITPNTVKNIAVFPSGEKR